MVDNAGSEEQMNDSDRDIGNLDPEDVPSADIGVEARVHFAMTGSFPMRIAELFFTDGGMYIAEYSYITPLFGLGTRKHRRDADAMDAIYRKYGIDGALMHADRLLWLNYGLIDRVVLHDGGLIGNPKVTVYAADDQSYAYRLIGETDFEAVRTDVLACADRHEFDAEISHGVGLHPRENVTRFFGQP